MSIRELRALGQSDAKHGVEYVQYYLIGAMEGAVAGDHGNAGMQRALKRRRQFRQPCRRGCDQRGFDPLVRTADDGHADQNEGGAEHALAELSI